MVRAVHEDETTGKGAPSTDIYSQRQYYVFSFGNEMMVF